MTAEEIKDYLDERIAIHCDDQNIPEGQVAPDWIIKEQIERLNKLLDG